MKISLRILTACLVCCLIPAAQAKRAPNLELKDLAGNTHKIAELRGSIVVLNFWATWCAPCQVEMPRFVQWQSQYGPRGLQIIGISMDDDPALARRLCAKLKVNYPVAMGDEKIGELYGGILGLPVTFLIDANGEICLLYTSPCGRSPRSESREHPGGPWPTAPPRR